MWILAPPTERFFSAEQLAQVRELFDAILPGDPARGIPGATAAGAAEFASFLLALTAETYYEIPAWQQQYREGLPRLNAASEALYGRPIEQLSSDEQTGLLARLESGQLEAFGAPAEQKAFFATLRRHCIQGCFADPRWGGNRERVMWRWFGYLQPAEELVLTEDVVR